MQIEPVREVGDFLVARINATYNEIVETLGFEPNVTDLDDPSKVKAAWGFTVDGERAAIWCYKVNDPRLCNSWSFYGNIEDAQKLFGFRKVSW